MSTMVNCVIKNCKSRSTKGMKLYRVPPYSRFDNTLLSWMEFVRIDRPDWKPTPSSRLCGLHFTEDSFYKGTTGNKLLKRTAVPTIHVVTDEQGAVRQPRQESNNKAAKLKTQAEKEAVQNIDETHKKEGSKNDGLDLLETSSGKKRKDSKSMEKEQDSVQKQVDNATLKKVSLLCRVCGQAADKKSVSIFSPKGKTIALEEKILRFLHIIVNRKDVGMPQKVCSQCVMQLHKCQELYEMASRAETQFRDMLQPPLPESNQPSVAVENMMDPPEMEEGDEIHLKSEHIMEQYSEVEVDPLTEEPSFQDEAGQQVISKKRTTSSSARGSPKRKCKLQTREMNFEILVQHCSLCDLDLPSFSELQTHYLDIHQKHLCGLCTTSLHFFDSTVHLNEHYREIHKCTM
ncbi:hypothetical protein B566_EDAN012562 [Ephemera danica]|nr:hypothetical protein B566_EDAN012562 [Ephemera danica]